MRTVAQYGTKAFCGNYSKDGSVFLSACQDQTLRVYDTTDGKFKKFKEIKARDVGWSILDTAFRYYIGVVTLQKQSCFLLNLYS